MHKDQHFPHCASPHFISILRKYKKQTNSIHLNALSAFYLFQHRRLKRYTFILQSAVLKMAFTPIHPPTHPPMNIFLVLQTWIKMILKCPHNAPKMFPNCSFIIPELSQNVSKIIPKFSWYHFKCFQIFIKSAEQLMHNWMEWIDNVTFLFLHMAHLTATIECQFVSIPSLPKWAFWNKAPYYANNLSW